MKEKNTDGTELFMGWYVLGLRAYRCVVYRCRVIGSQASIDVSTILLSMMIQSSLN
jgi:hypothetical protein